MSDAIWFELADGIGDALAKRWLARRRGQRTHPATNPAMDTTPPPKGQRLENTPTPHLRQTDLTSDE
jgi:hypothetical protein